MIHKLQGTIKFTFTTLFHPRKKIILSREHMQHFFESFTNIIHVTFFLK